ncbi:MULTISPECIES: tetratricopeptide repeat protein [unclassified Okeania]|uniref:CHAT domain-containing tetratricopeptide repeat protein n=1 Tax=unclassified Okeania TaxID=2634635 RepID=UPI00257EFDB8|nr:MULTISPECIES: tetratricopeptide repeat protein [unclassified Okeania]
MKKSLIKLSILSVFTVVAVTGFWVGMPELIVEQALSQVSEQEELAEVKRLVEQIIQLNQQGKYAEAIPLAEKALEIRKRALGDNHLDVARSLNDLGRLYQSQGKYKEAEPLYQKSLAIRKQKLGDNHPDVAISLNNLAVLYYQQGKYSEAEPLYQKSLDIRKEQLGDDHLDVAQSFNNLALLYYQQGRYSEAEPLYQKSLDIREQQLGENHPLIANTLNTLALLYQSQGRYSEAESLYQESLDIREQQLGDNHPGVAISLNNLALLYQSQGRYSEAEPLYKRSLGIWKKQLGDNHPYVALNLQNLANLYFSLGRYSEAEPLLKKSLDIRKQTFGENHLYVATTLKELAFCYRSQGRYPEAESLYKKSLAIRKQQLGDEHPSVISLFSSLAALYHNQGRYAEAELLYQKYLAIDKQKLRENHLSVATTLNNWGWFYQSQGNITRSIEFLSQGLAIEEHNISKNLVLGDARQKRDYINKFSETTNSTISLNLQFAPNNPKVTRLALKTIFERKGRILGVLTNSLQILRQQTDDPDTQKLLNQLIAKRTQLSNLNFKKPEDFPSPDIYRQELTKVEKEVKELEGKLSRRSAEFGNLSQPITIEKIQQQIPAGTALVELVHYRPVNPKAPRNERFGKPRYAAYVLYQNGEPQAIDLGEAAPIDKTVEKLRRFLRDLGFTPEQLKHPARELDEMVMQPVRQLLGNTKTILLSPDAALNLIPFEALADENNQYLVENYQITYLTSGRDLLRQNPKNNRQTPLVIANPKYQQQGEIIALDNYRYIDLSDRGFPSLRGTQIEAETISQLFPEALILTKTNATENALKQVKNPDFLHIATHGFFLLKPTSENSTNSDNPLFRSGLVFAGVEKRQSGGDDGVFSADEATLLNLVGTQLVVLSACDTGIGDIAMCAGIFTHYFL